MNESKLPPMAEAHINMTPDDGLPLRILMAYRRRCDEKWGGSGVSDGTKFLFDAMNEAQDQRAAILDRAIECLK